MSVTYTATLSVREETMLSLSGLLHAERLRRGTRRDRRALVCFKQAVLILRWFLDGTRVKQLATDNGIGKSTAYTYLYGGIAVLAARAPKLESALLAAKMAGYSHINIDGTLIETDRCRTPGPTPGVDLWWSGKHHNHGGNIQVITAPDGWPLWTSPVRPGRHHHRRVQKTQRRRTDRHRASLQHRPQRTTRHRRTRQLPAEDHLQSAVQRQHLPLEDRRYRRRSTRPTPHRTRPHNLTTQRHQPLPGKAQCVVLCAAEAHVLAASATILRCLPAQL
jgi:hypothetical protein